MVGEWAVDYVCPSGRNCTKEKVAFFAGYNSTMTGTIYGGVANAILGLGVSHYNKPKQFVNILKSIGYIPETAYWYEKQISGSDNINDTINILPQIDTGNFDYLVFGRPYGTINWADVPSNIAAWAISVRWNNFNVNK